MNSARNSSANLMRSAVRWVLDHRLVLIVGLIAATPVVVSTVRAVLAGWTPVFDDAVVATRSFDVFSAHSPLVGEYSDASVPSVGTVFSPGPMLFWLLAVQAHLLGDWSFPVTMGLVNIASIMGAVALARRRGGRWLMFATAIALAFLCRSLGQERLHDIVNSTAGLLPFTLLLFLAWSVGCGEYRLLPLAVLVASFVAEAHFSFDPATLVVFVVAAAGFVISPVWTVHPPAWAGTSGAGGLARSVLPSRAGALPCSTRCSTGPATSGESCRPRPRTSGPWGRRGDGTRW